MIRDLEKHLTKHDLAASMAVAFETLSCADLESFQSTVLSFQRLTPFENSLCAHGNILQERTKKIPALTIVDVSYPDHYVQHYMERGYHVTDPLIEEAVIQLKPSNWGKSARCKSLGIEYVRSIDADAFHFRDGWTFATFEPDLKSGSLFWLGGSSIDHSERTRTIIEYTVPFLAQALKRIVALQPVKEIHQEHSHRLTPTELEVLKWLKEGKTNWEISLILNRSQRVINFHVNNIKAKLNAVNRTQAVVIALEKGVIEF